MLTKKQLLRYFKRRRYGGRNLFARTLDYIALRVILFVAAFLFFRLHLDTPRSALLAALSLAVASLLLHVAREIAMARFIEKETIRIRRFLMRERLMFLPEAAFLELCQRSSGAENPIPMQRAAPMRCCRCCVNIRIRRWSSVRARALHPLRRRLCCVPSAVRG